MSAPRQRQLILAIECSNPSAATVGRGLPASVALAYHSGSSRDRSLQFAATEPIASSAGPAGRGGHDDDLLPAIERACRAAGVTPKDITTVAVSLGPGGYTSLRIAVAAAKMISLATGAKLIGVPTAFVAARASINDRPVPTSILVALASKNDAASLTHLRNDRFNQPLTVVSSGVFTAADVPAPLAPMHPPESPPVLIADQFLPASIADAAQRLGYERIPLVLTANDCLKTAIVDKHPFSDPHTLAPIYAREPDAVTLWRARHPGSPA